MDREAVRDLMWRSVGLFRTREGLGQAVDLLARARSSAPPTTAAAWRERNLLTVARLIAGAALRREESRGGHFRDDFPEKDPSYGKFNIVIRRGPGGEMQVTREPIPEMREDLKRIVEENK